jgi:peptidoglycan/xylan/chitin deacetylase (PgdA/CDA1 family)
MNHVNGWKTSTEDYLDNVKKFDSAAAEFGGIRTKTDLFRPPYGRITRRQIKALAGYRIIMWDVLSQDYSQHLSSEHCLRSTIRACRPGSIVVFHDSYKSEKNMHHTLPRLIDHFAGQGYTFGKL